MTAKRFQVETDEGFVVSLKDNLTKKYPFSLSCESVDDYENLIDEVMNCGVLLNQLWKQTQRFEKHNQRLEKENEQLKAQLLYDGDGVCTICKHQCLVENGKYYVARCEKEHEECSKVDLRYCEDFELVRDYE